MRTQRKWWRARKEKSLRTTAEELPEPELHMQRVSRYGQWRSRSWFAYEIEVDATGVTLFGSTFDNDNDLQRLRQPRRRTLE